MMDCSRCGGIDDNVKPLLLLLLSIEFTPFAWPAEGTFREENFDREPVHWDAINNRNAHFTPKAVTQDFGYSASTRHAGGQPGEIGGKINPAGEAAYYAYRLPNSLTLDDPMSASGKILVPRGPGHFLLGFFNAGTLNEWCLATLTLNTPLYARGKICVIRSVTDSTASIGFYNSTSSLRSNPRQDQSIPMDYLGINIEGPSSEGFFYPVYRVHGDAAGALVRSAGKAPRIYPDRKVHDWTLSYEPAGAGGRGQITVRLDNHACTLALEPGAKSTGASFDRFGLCTPWIDGNSVTVFFDDLQYTCRPVSSR